MSQITWPEVLTTGTEPENYKTDPRRKWLLCADGLAGWSACVIDTPPAKFGWGMIVIADVLGCGPTGPDFIQWSKENPVPEEITRQYAPEMLEPAATITTANRYAVIKPSIIRKTEEDVPLRDETPYVTIYSKRTHKLLQDKFYHDCFEESTNKPYYRYYNRK